MTHIPQTKSVGSTLQYFILVLKTLTGMGSTTPKEHSSFHMSMLLLNLHFFSYHLSTWEASHTVINSEQLHWPLRFSTQECLAKYFSQ